eukprot:Plantae.Rhodophyta-Purpureofilum_apyrenoidigerum.ctg14973.p2 GENE.Plantae.Rhodophyta-Purpureofilum_apyrenoidigerum.ctg14973~~Plantae.Rhodophyta-Purpureofilum_apyrenoidigerum.ctg14973.p2  ORF type:complete len:149 (+),score=26.86 Plantae.Rhodophyta-Purpureofilum_apyrenoidigerum.ctg14973:94-540(+)
MSLTRIWSVGGRSVWRSNAVQRTGLGLFRQSIRHRTSEDADDFKVRHRPAMAGSAMSANELIRLPRNNIEKRVLRVVSGFPKVNAGAVNMNARFEDDLGLDSLDSVEMVIAFEDEFEIAIPDDDADKIRSCREAIDYIDNMNIRQVPP